MRERHQFFCQLTLFGPWELSLISERTRLFLPVWIPESLLIWKSLRRDTSFFPWPKILSVLDRICLTPSMACSIWCSRNRKPQSAQESLDLSVTAISIQAFQLLDWSMLQTCHLSLNWTRLDRRQVVNRLRSVSVLFHRVRSFRKGSMQKPPTEFFRIKVFFLNPRKRV